VAGRVAIIEVKWRAFLPPPLYSMPKKTQEMLFKLIVILNKNVSAKNVGV